MSIWRDWSPPTFGLPRTRRTKRAARASRRRGYSGGLTRRLIERLEDRRVLSVTSSFAANTLTINLTANDTIAIYASGGNVQLNINGIGGIDPDGVVSATDVHSIVVTGTGNFANTIDLTGVDKSDYSSLLTVALDGGDGGDDYKIDQSILPAAAVINVVDTGLTGSDSLELSTTGAGPETIGISDVSVSRSSGPAVAYAGLEALAVDGTNGGDTINVTKTNAATATTSQRRLWFRHLRRDRPHPNRSSRSNHSRRQ